MKTANFQASAIGDSAEQVFEVAGLILSQDDSLHFEVLSQRDLVLWNAGSAKSYNLNLRMVSAAGEVLFEHDNVALAENSSHHITPAWDTLSAKPVTIHIDLDNNGTVDDSVVVDNQITNVETGSLDAVPQLFKLHQNYPNPFNPTTTIGFALPKAARVTIRVYDTLGREIAVLANGEYQPGEHRVIWDAGNLASGLYFYRITADEFAGTKKLLLLK